MLRDNINFCLLLICLPQLGKLRLNQVNRKGHPGSVVTYDVAVCGGYALAGVCAVPVIALASWHEPPNKS